MTDMGRFRSFKLTPYIDIYESLCLSKRQSFKEQVDSQGLDFTGASSDLTVTNFFRAPNQIRSELLRFSYVFGASQTCVSLVSFAL